MILTILLLLLIISLKIASLSILLFSIIPQVYREMKQKDMIFSIRIALLIFVIDYTLSIILSFTEDIFHYLLAIHPIQIIVITVIRGISFLVGVIVLYFIYHQHYTKKD